MRIAIIAFGAALLCSAQTVLPEGPRVFVDTSTMPSVTGISRAVHAGDNLQTVINAANLGDEIVLDAGASFTGNFTLPVKSGFGWITIRSSRLSSLPPSGTRVDPSNVANMATIIGAGTLQTALVNDSNNPVHTSRATHHWWFAGIEITHDGTGTNPFYLIFLSPKSTADNSQTTAGMPHDITFDRCYIHRNVSANGTNHLIGFSVNNGAIIDSYLSHRINSPNWTGRTDGTGVLCLTCTGVKLYNNFIEAETENVMFGGDTGITGVTPSDIEIRHNYFRKDPAWISQTSPNDAYFHGGCFKNLLEFKAGQRAIVSDNVFEHHWASCGWFGPAITLTQRPAQSGAWTRVTDVSMQNNVVRDVGEFASETATDNYCLDIQNGTANVAGAVVTVTSTAPPTSYNAGFMKAYAVYINGAGPYKIISSTSTTSFTIDTSVGPLTGATISVDQPCRGEAGDQLRFAYINNLFDQINGQSATGWTWNLAENSWNEQLRHVTFNRNTVLLGRAGPSFLYFSRHACTDKAFFNLEFKNNIIQGLINADCGTNPATLFHGALGYSNVSGNLHIGATATEQTSWNSFTGALGFPANPAAVGFAAGNVALAVTSPYFGQPVGADLTCLDQNAIRNGTPTALCGSPGVSGSGYPRKKRILR